MAFSVLISVYMSPFTGGATGFPTTTAPSGAASDIGCLVLSSMKYLAGERPACTLDAAAAAAACEAALVVSAAARSSATSRSSSRTPVA